LIPPLDKKLFFEKGKELDKYLENLQEINVLNKKGKELSIAFILKKMGLATENHFIGIVTDIADRKAAERLLIQKKEQAEEANRLKSEFLNVISHELRTPLTVILGNTPLLTDQEYYPEQEDLIEIASDIDSSARHLLVLINDLLDLSKIEAGKMELKLDIIIVKELLTVVFEQFQVLAEKKSIKLELSLDSNLEILADPVRLQQIIINLVGNSIKFTEKGFIKVTVRQLGKQIQFFVEDSGCGMSDILLGDIFDAFKQVDSSSTRSAEGTGLGLAITQKLIELHQGNIFVSSEVGKGTTFVFSLPCEAVPVVVPEEVIA
ncbi:MAG: signal transduction histidine kinase, partial [bacterium]